MSAPCLEQTTVRMRGLLLDETGATVTTATLTAFTLTLFDLATGTILNSRNAQTVLGASGVSVNGVTLYDTLQTDPQDGVIYNLLWLVTPADNTIVDDAVKYETHRALFQWTWSAGTKKGKHYEDLKVENLQTV